MDILYINHLTVMAKIGVHNWERKCHQKLIFDLKIFYNNCYKINYGNTLNYLDYSKINPIILNIINSKYFFLIEDVAEIIAKTLINKFTIISKIQVKVNKPGAIQNAYNVGICINRKKIHNSKEIKIYIK